MLTDRLEADTTYAYPRYMVLLECIDVTKNNTGAGRCAHGHSTMS